MSGTLSGDIILASETHSPSRNSLVLGTKTDIWRVDTIGEGEFKHAVRKDCNTQCSIKLTHEFISRVTVQIGFASTVRFVWIKKSKWEGSKLPGSVSRCVYV